MHTVQYVLAFPTQLSGLTFLRQFFISRACSLFKPKVQCLLNMGNHWLGDQLLSRDFSEIDLFLLHLTCCLRTTSRVLPKYYTLNPKVHLLN